MSTACYPSVAVRGRKRAAAFSLLSTKGPRAHVKSSGRADGLFGYLDVCGRPLLLLGYSQEGACVLTRVVPIFAGVRWASVILYSLAGCLSYQLHFCLLSAIFNEEFEGLSSKAAKTPVLNDTRTHGACMLLYVFSMLDAGPRSCRTARLC